MPEDNTPHILQPNENTGSETHKMAAALSFDPETDDAPILRAVGKGHLATRIIETAHENDIPVVQDDNLVSTLASLNLGETIPPQLYEVVARLLIFISKLDQIN